MYSLGFDIGSSSVKVSLVNLETGRNIASAFYPKKEAEITALQQGWAEQEPEDWWKHMKESLADVLSHSKVNKKEILSIGISYQMHGLVMVNKSGKVLRKAIIWCDSRGVPYGERAFKDLGKDLCLEHLLNQPGNFTATKLAWVKENEPDIFAQTDKIMLPGDYMAWRLTGRMATTVAGLSEMMLWDFKEDKPAGFLMQYFGFKEEILPQRVPTFSLQGHLTEAVAEELGLTTECQVCYRGGDQPNNALSLNVFEPGEIASTAGTSGVVYGILGGVNYDERSRVNTFAHVNHQKDNPRLGVMVCVSGTGILNSWAKRNIAPEGISYERMNDLASQVPVGSEGLSVLPFGNGAERVLENRETGAMIEGINFLTHDKRHILRAAQEGIVFSFCYGIEIMKRMGMEVRTIHAGKANMFLSPIFRNTLATVADCEIELYDTDGSVGAAKGAGMGLGFYKDHNEAFRTLELLERIQPDKEHRDEYLRAYATWKERLERAIG